MLGGHRMKRTGSQWIGLIVLSTLGLSACSDGGVDDADDDFLVGGKSDTSGIGEGSPEALGVLALVNQASENALDAEVGLDRRAAANIVDHRIGDDGRAGSKDDDPFDDLAELDAISFVGPIAFEKLLAFAIDSGLVATEPCADLSPFACMESSLCEFTPGHPCDPIPGGPACPDDLGPRCESRPCAALSLDICEENPSCTFVPGQPCDPIPGGPACPENLGPHCE